LFSSHNFNDHKVKAEHDREIAKMLCEKNIFPDWAIISSFYFALHYVDAYAHRCKITAFEPTPTEARKGKTSHLKRKDFVRGNLGSLWDSYNRLYSRCRQCRYDPKFFRFVPTDETKKLFEEAEKFSCLF